MKNISKTYFIEATLANTYDALTNAILIGEWTGTEAEMESKEGGTFSLWGGSIHGYNRLLTETKIVQDWKEKRWEDFSKVIITLKPTDGGVTLNLDHENVPDDSANDIDEGWDEYYLGPLKKFLES